MPIDFHLATPRDSGLQHQMGNLLAEHMATADMLGRMQILRHAEQKTGRKLPLATHSRLVKFSEDDSDTIGFAFDIGGDDVARKIRNLTPVTRQVFDGLTSQYKRDAFTLAGTSDVRLIERIRDELAQAGQSGETQADFMHKVHELTSAAGVEDLNAFTLETAFQTAMQKAYSSGRLDQMQEPHMLEALPFWQYWTVGDLRVRPEHRALDGFLARAIDPVWRKIYPPCGFNCRCSVVPMDADEAMKIDPDCSEGGMERLPALARMLVPQPGFASILAH